jgi:predicted DNA-binding transcriptional regulator AlpA
LRIHWGSHPINAATLWRGVKAGIFPRPVKVSPNSNRWRKAELAEALERRAALRDRPANAGT